MSNKTRIQGICLLIAAILIFVFMIMTSNGCVGNPLYKPSVRLNDTIIPEYIEYVKSDPKLSPEQKARRIKGANHYGKLLRDYGTTEKN